MTKHSSLSRLYQFPISRLVLLVALAWSSLTFCDRFVAAAWQDTGEKVWYEAETRVGGDASGIFTLYAGAGSIVVYDGKRNGVPIFIGFAVNGRVQGEYGVDGTGRPENKGRVIYRGGMMPYTVTGTDNIYTYHLKYLELTTVGDAAHNYRAYATKAIASDNYAEALKGGTITYKLPEGAELIIDNGKIKVGDNYISPNYDLTGEIEVSQAPRPETSSPGAQAYIRRHAGSLLIVAIVLVVGGSLVYRRLAGGEGQKPNPNPNPNP
ncbi:MAG: hypothetical protein ACLQOO_12085 [Terriglobia bacterium]